MRLAQNFMEKQMENHTFWKVWKWLDFPILIHIQIISWIYSGIPFFIKVYECLKFKCGGFTQI